MTLLIGVITSALYEVLIHINECCKGIGGRVGATTFLATTILARYKREVVVGKRMRRALWKSGAGLSGLAVSMIFYHIIGSVATIYLRLRESSDGSAAADPVRASSVVGLTGSLFFKDPAAILALY